MKQTPLALALSLSLNLSAATADTGDQREKVNLPAPMNQHMLANMRDHLAVITEILQALAAGKSDWAADIAEKRIGMSSLASHGAAHLAPHMPKPMQQIGTAMHRAASQFALVAKEVAVDGDTGRAVGALAKVTQQCVACHAAYRLN